MQAKRALKGVYLLKPYSVAAPAIALDSRVHLSKIDDLTKENFALLHWSITFVHNI